MKFLTSTFALFTLATQTMGSSMEIEVNSRSLRSSSVTQCKAYGLNDGEAVLSMCSKGSPLFGSLCTYTLSNDQCLEAAASGVSQSKFGAATETYVIIADNSIVAIGELPSDLFGLFMAGQRPIRNLRTVSLPSSTQAVEFFFQTDDSSKKDVKNLQLQLDLSSWTTFAGELIIWTGPYSKLDLSLGSIPIVKLNILAERYDAPSALTNLKISDLSLLSHLQSFSVEGMGAVESVSFSFPSSLVEFDFLFNRFVQSLDITIPEISNLQIISITRNTLLTKVGINNAHGNKLPASLRRVEITNNASLRKISNIDLSLVASSALSLDFGSNSLTSDSFIRGIPQSLPFDHLGLSGNTFNKCPTKWADSTIVSDYSPPNGC